MDVAPGSGSDVAAAPEDAPLRRALDWLADGRGVAIATVVGTWGSSPRPPGSVLVVADDGSFEGSVSGGCVEGAVVTEAIDIIGGAPAKLLDFGVSDERAWEVGLACGGQMSVFVERAGDPELIRALIEERPVALVTRLDGGGQTVVRRRDGNGGTALGKETVDAVLGALDADRSVRLDDPAGEMFVTVFNDRPRIVVIGAVHIAQALAPMAVTAGFDVTIIDPRRSFASEARFPGIHLSNDWPDEALADLRPDARTAVVTLSHDPKLDDPALDVALRSEAFYVGALGSQKTQRLRRERLAAAGFGDADLARIRGPIGLDLGGRKAPEIAVAILAQIVAARHGRELGR